MTNPRSCTGGGGTRALVLLAPERNVLFSLPCGRNLSWAWYPRTVTEVLTHWEMKQIVHVPSCQQRPALFSGPSSVLGGRDTIVDVTQHLHSKNSTVPHPPPDFAGIPPSPATCQLPLPTLVLRKAGGAQCHSLRATCPTLYRNHTVDKGRTVGPVGQTVSF